MNLNNEQNNVDYEKLQAMYTPKNDSWINVWAIAAVGIALIFFVGFTIFSRKSREYNKSAQQTTIHDTVLVHDTTTIPDDEPYAVKLFGRDGKNVVRVIMESGAEHDFEY